MSKGLLCIEDEIFILSRIEEFIFDGSPEALFNCEGWCEAGLSNP
jgi:hypothetical protein